MTAEPSRLDVHQRRCSCARCHVEAALLLLRTGRADMALTVLGPVPDLITEDRGWAYAAGHHGIPLGRFHGAPPAGGSVVPFSPDRVRGAA